MKISELEGAQLDYWVARAEGIEHPKAMRAMEAGFVMVPYQTKDDEGSITAYRAFEPSSSWTDAGPIIEREHGKITWDSERYYADMGADPLKRYREFGPTCLVAAMRAYVASKFGDEVPDEVQP